MFMLMVPTISTRDAVLSRFENRCVSGHGGEAECAMTQTDVEMYNYTFYILVTDCLGDWESLATTYIGSRSSKLRVL
jgi:hypothetical protein